MDKAGQLLLFQLLAIPFLFFESVLFGVVPMFFRKLGVILSLANSFAGGVFLSVGLLHMLPDAVEDFSKVHIHSPFPVGFVCGITGFMVVLCLEKVLLGGLGHHDASSSSCCEEGSCEDVEQRRAHGLGVGGGVEAGAPISIPDGNGGATTHPGVSHSLHSASMLDGVSIDSSSLKEEQSIEYVGGYAWGGVSGGGVDGSTTGGVHSGDGGGGGADGKIVPHNGESKRLLSHGGNSHATYHGSTQKNVQRGEDKKTLGHGPHTHHDHYIPIRGGKPWVPYIIAAVLSVHSFIAGIALGIQPKMGDAVVIFIALAAHKWTEAFAFGVSFVTQKIPFKRWIGVLVLYSIMVGVGQVIGILLHSVLRGTAVWVVEGTAVGLAAGTFLYVSIVDIVEEEFNEYSPPLIRYGKLLSMVVGIVFIAAVTLLE